MTQPITAWDTTLLDMTHTSPGPTSVTRLGQTFEGLITRSEQLLIPADMNPTSPWAVEARTGEIANLLAAQGFLSRNWAAHGACISYAGIDATPTGPHYRWEIWDCNGLLIDLVQTPTQDWTMKRLHVELRQAGWLATAGAADPFTPFPEHRTWADNQPVRIRPGKPFRWLIPSGGDRDRQWPLHDDQVTAALTQCRSLGLAALRAVAAHTDERRLESRRAQARAALVGVVDRHLSRGTFPDSTTDHPEDLCSCPALPPADTNPTSGHHPQCACHEPALLRAAARRRFETLIGHHV